MASREAESASRQAAQQALARTLAFLNQSLGAEHLAAPLVQTAGDEIQGLLRTASASVDVIQSVTDQVFAVAGFRMAFGVGFGGIATGAIPEAPNQAPNAALLDGPAFHQAREALEHAKGKRSWAVFRGFGEGRDAALDGLFELMGALRARWTSTQASYGLELRTLELQKDVAAKFGVSPSVVSESLKSAAFDAVLRGEQRAKILLEVA